MKLIFAVLAAYGSHAFITMQASPAEWSQSVRSNCVMTAILFFGALLFFGLVHDEMKGKKK